jgi:anti-sigma B factor antagonist
MEVKLKPIAEATVVELVGEIDGNTALQAQQQILPLVQPGCKIVLDMSGVPYMSSAGLRMFLLIYRRIPAASGRIVLVGLAEEIKETMSLTGFLDFFETADTLAAGLDAVAR